MAYTLHMELTDGTLQDAFHTVATKRQAIRAARVSAKMESFMVARIIVNDAEEMTVASFATPEWKE